MSHTVNQYCLYNTHWGEWHQFEKCSLSLQKFTGGLADGSREPLLEAHLRVECTNGDISTLGMYIRPCGLSCVRLDEYGIYLQVDVWLNFRTLADLTGPCYFMQIDEWHTGPPVRLF